MIRKFDKILPHQALLNGMTENIIYENKQYWTQSELTSKYMIYTL